MGLRLVGGRIAGDRPTVAQAISIVAPAPVVDGCLLSTWQGDPDCCRWCNASARPLSIWCSLACEDLFEAEHEWGQAHAAALVRDRDRCVDCGTGPASAAEARLFIRAMIPLEAVQSAELWRSQEWMAVQLACSVDVLHRMPPPQSYRSGCHNHISGLVTLCRRCQERARSSVNLRTG